MELPGKDAKEGGQQQQEGSLISSVQKLVIDTWQIVTGYPDHQNSSIADVLTGVIKHYGNISLQRQAWNDVKVAITHFDENHDKEVENTRF
jgi:hypothetical protein